jgi:hypothetical protein
LLLAPRPFGHWGQRFERFEATGVADTAEIGAFNTHQHAYLMRPVAAPIQLAYTVAESAMAAPDWIWQPQHNRHTLADASLQAMAGDLCSAAEDDAGKLRAIVDHAAALFSYGHGESRFTDGHDAVPALCGTTRGSCVDINTLVLAAARSQGLAGQYIAGYWFGPERFETPDMHCWLAFEIDGTPEYWDVAHHLKWGVAPLAPGLNPAGGWRIAMTSGRGLIFDTPQGRVAISHFSEPLWVLSGAETRQPAVRIQMEEIEA